MPARDVVLNVVQELITMYQEKIANLVQVVSLPIRTARYRLIIALFVLQERILLTPAHGACHAKMEHTILILAKHPALTVLPGSVIQSWARQAAILIALQVHIIQELIQQ